VGDAASRRDTYFGRVLRDAKPSTRTGRAAALTVYFQFLQLRHKVELHNLTGCVVECPLDEINCHVPGSMRSCAFRRPPRRSSSCSPDGASSWSPAASSPRPHATTPSPGRRLMSGFASTRRGCSTWTTCAGSSGGSASRTSVTARDHAAKGPKPRLVPLINGADRSLRWFIEDVLGLFDIDLAGRKVPPFPSERKNTDRTWGARKAGVRKYKRWNGSTGFDQWRHIQLPAPSSVLRRRRHQRRKPTKCRTQKPIRHMSPDPLQHRRQVQSRHSQRSETTCPAETLAVCTSW
jgi:hypothetical protein